MFKYDRDRNQWTRILHALQGLVIELAITPYGGYHGDWNEVRDETFFAHHNMPSAGDDLMLDLPIVVQTRLVVHVGPQIAQKLVGHHYWEDDLTPRQVSEAVLRAGYGLTRAQLPEVCAWQPVNRYPTITQPSAPRHIIGTVIA